MNPRRALLILVVVLFLVGIGFAVYIIMKPRAGEPSPQGNGGPSGPNLGNNGSLPPVSTPGGEIPDTSASFGVASPHQVADYFVDNQNNVLILKPDGVITRSDGTNEDTISSVEIANLIRGSFSYDGQKVLIEFGTPQKPQASVFDIVEKSWRPLPEGARGSVWAPSGYTLAFYNRVQNSARIQTIDLGDNKSTPKDALSMKILDPVIAWESPSRLIIGDRPSALVASSFFLLDLATKLISPVIQDYKGLSLLWNPNLSFGLLFVSTDYSQGGSLSLISNKGVVLNKLNFLTLPSKCVFAPAASPSSTDDISKPIYCAIPNNYERLAFLTLPDAYERKEFYTLDSIYLIDAAYGDLTPILQNEYYDIDATNLKVFRDKLFFVNRIDNRLYGVSLRESPVDNPQ